jgi:hypothetical protein
MALTLGQISPAFRLGGQRSPAGWGVSAACDSANRKKLGLEDRQVDALVFLLVEICLTASLSFVFNKLCVEFDAFRHATSAIVSETYSYRRGLVPHLVPHCDARRNSSCLVCLRPTSRSTISPFRLTSRSPDANPRGLSWLPNRLRRGPCVDRLAIVCDRTRDNIFALGVICVKFVEPESIPEMAELAVGAIVHCPLWPAGWMGLSCLPPLRVMGQSAIGGRPKAHARGYSGVYLGIAEGRLELCSQERGQVARRRSPVHRSA